MQPLSLSSSRTLELANFLPPLCFLIQAMITTTTSSYCTCHRHVQCQIGQTIHLSILEMAPQLSTHKTGSAQKKGLIMSMSACKDPAFASQTSEWTFSAFLWVPNLQTSQDFMTPPLHHSQAAQLHNCTCWIVLRYNVCVNVITVDS